MGSDAYEIVCRPDRRFIITGSITGKVIDDAQGYGYSTKQKAERAAWYKFKGGKAKMDASERQALLFWRKHKDLARAIGNFQETWFKEIGRGGINLDAEASQLAIEHDADGFDPRFLRHLREES